MAEKAAPHPLGMPRGSIRALLALTIFGTTMALLIVGRDVDHTLWLVTTVVLGYYFATRQAHDTVGGSSGSPPLGLPSGTVRWLLFLGFAGTAGYLGWQWHEQGANPIDEKAFFPVLALASFFGGVLFRKLFRRGEWKILDNVKGLLALGCAVSVVVIYFLEMDFAHVVQVKRSTLSFIIFYFGSR